MTPTQQYVFEFDGSFYVKEWKSNCTFHNCFYENKETIVKIINQFVHSKSRYHMKGIPHTLIIAVYGESGCGKTSFVKSIVNHFPEKHLVRIQCNDLMDMRQLYRSLFHSPILHHFYVPFEKRIIVLDNIHLVTSSMDIKYLHKIIDDETNDRIIIMTTDSMEDMHHTLLRSINLTIQCKKSSCADIKNIIEHYWDTLSPEISFRANRRVSAAEIIHDCRCSDNLLDTVSLIESRVIKKTSMWKDEFDLLLPKYQLHKMK